MASTLGPLLLVLLGTAGLVVLFGRKLRAAHAALGAAARAAGGAPVLPQPGGSLTRRGVRAIRVLSAGVVRVVVAVARVLTRLLQRPPVSARVPRLSLPTPAVWRVLSFGRSGAAPPPAERPPPGESPRPAEAPLATAGALPAPPEPKEAVAAVPERAAVLEELSQPVAVVGDAEPPPILTADSTPEPRAAAATPTPPPARSSRAAAGPVLEPHVDEQGYRRRKIVGHVRGHRPAASLQRPETRSAPKPIRRAPEAGRPRPPAGDLSEVPALLKKGELAKAESELIEALAANPRDLHAYRLLGQLYLQRGDMAQAREVCEEALRRDASATDLHGILGRVYASLGQYSNALTHFQRAHDADERNLEHLEEILRIAAHMDRRPLVRVTAEKILALQPNHAAAKKHLARAVG